MSNTEPRKTASQSWTIAYTRAAARGDYDRQVQLLAVPTAERPTWKPKR